MVKMCFFSASVDVDDEKNEKIDDARKRAHTFLFFFLFSFFLKKNAFRFFSSSAPLGSPSLKPERSQHAAPRQVPAGAR